MILKKKHSQDKTDKNISALQVCAQILPIHRKKTIQNTIAKRKIARWNTLTSVWPRVSNQDPKKLFFNPE